MSASRDAFLSVPGNDPWTDEPPTGERTMNDDNDRGRRTTPAPTPDPLRDYFAAAALAAALGNFDVLDSGSIPKAATLAYSIADAMIAERAKA